MANNKIKEALFSPFRYIAGGKSLTFGLLTMVLISVLGYWSHTHFDGVIDIHYGTANQSATYIQHLGYQLVAWLILTVLLYVAARIVSKSTFRLIDLGGTVALSQAPLILPAIWGFIPSVHLDIDPSQTNISILVSQLQQNIGIFLLTLVLVILVLVWNIVLKYNAYSVSTNVKGKAGYISFGIALFASEIISTILIRFLITSL